MPLFHSTLFSLLIMVLKIKIIKAARSQERIRIRSLLRQFVAVDLEHLPTMPCDAVTQTEVSHPQDEETPCAIELDDIIEMIPPLSPPERPLTRQQAIARAEVGETVKWKGKTRLCVMCTNCDNKCLNRGNRLCDRCYVKSRRGSTSGSK